ncbi:GumC family protein [Amphiplicatus metriothermophilus]|uniref:Uncharacterized protein involved in exopolysaccharide biosynthesis n=1 Tax=Amphiplicatus metriothermophilus TaxID=1519374 RepID=A0A239PL70_9PROT|nr:hypothetical protein [Amphiplicatus metriothermophilus]MBB5517842.1 uncharacterized protein involved in exopolysaccharide biosynthesis [Amphiplicatus metriothermophilus]SNT67824.1 Uncharacterized protein involved in exopolysaccharide biosynthesis [Amphiplicatus metriothermophilus]
MREEFTLEDALIILRRRLWYFLLPFALFLAVGVGVVALLPAQYTAQGTILVESAQIPPDLVRSTINAYAQERIQTIRQRVMTRNRLLEISDKFNVFPRDKYTSSDRVRMMRDRIRISHITVGGNRSRDNTIAFTVSYTDPSPDAAAKVANEVMSLFLTEDVRTRTAGAANTTEFFRQEVARLANVVSQVESRIAAFKTENADALPEHLNMHVSALERANRDLVATEASITALEEELRFLETQLLSYFAGANFDAGPAAELARLKGELVRLRAVYRDAHPSVRALKDQIAALERELTPNREIQNLQKTLAEAELAMQQAERELSPEDPALAQARERTTRLQTQLSEKIAEQASAKGGDFLSAQLQGRIAVANNRKSLLEAQRDKLKASIADLEARIARTPEVERELAALTRQHQNLYREYQDILAKQQAAQLAENLEDSQKAEKFSILEAATRPDRPSSPQRGKLAVLVFFFAGAAGGALALGSELLFGTVRGRNHLAKLLETDPLVIIPYIPSENERRIRWPFPFFRPKAAPAASAAAAALMAISTAGAPPAPTPQDNVNPETT